MSGKFTAQVRVMLKRAVLDPQGKAVLGALHSLGFAGVSDVRVGKFVRLELEAADREEAMAQARVMSQKLLANPVIEDFEIQIL